MRESAIQILYSGGGNMVRAAGWFLAAALGAGCATDQSVDGISPIGKVQSLYVEQYDGVFVDRQAATDDADKTVWAYVTFDEPLADGRKFATAVLEQDTAKARAFGSAHTATVDARRHALAPDTVQ
jgi:hypothetical protein